MSLIDYKRSEITRFRGAWSTTDPVDVSMPFALQARNVEFVSAQVQSRHGHSRLFQSEGRVTGMHSWLTSRFNILVFHDAGKVKARYFHPQNQTVTWYTQAGEGMTAAEAGLRLLIATYNAGMLGSGPCYVADATQYPAIYVARAFAAPLTTVPEASEPEAGRVTKGTHRIGYVMRSRSGYLGKLSPVIDGAFQPITFQASGDKIIRLAVTPAQWPSDADVVFAVMSTVDDPYRFFLVPGSECAVPPGGQGYTAYMRINWSDAELLINAADLDVTEHQYLLANHPVSGLPPFEPSVVACYGKRAVYVVDDTVYISDPGKYQHIVEDESYVILPGRLRVIAVFALRGVLYLLGPYWTYAVEDNNDRPVTWRMPMEIDGQRGAFGPRAVTVNQTAGYAWVANDSGLHLFTGGAYPDIPISYYNSVEWGRINRDAARTVVVADDVINHRVMVAAPLDSATTPSHILVWDYSEGRTPGTVRFSLWDIRDYSIGTMAIVKDYAAKRTLRYMAPASAGWFLREDSAVRNDDGKAITSVYETALMPPEGQRAPVNVIHGHQFRIRGGGNLDMNLYSTYRTDAQKRDRIELVADPKTDITLLSDIRAEQVSTELRMEGQPDGWWRLLRHTVYWTPYVGAR